MDREIATEFDCHIITYFLDAVMDFSTHCLGSKCYELDSTKRTWVELANTYYMYIVKLLTLTNLLVEIVVARSYKSVQWHITEVPIGWSIFMLAWERGQGLTTAWGGG